MDASADKKACIECGELIQSCAKRCPHCHSKQQPNKIELIATVSKWCGGITVVISVVMAVGDLTRITDNWLKDERYAQQLAEAAEIAMQQGDNSIAVELLNEAAALKPASEEVRRKQVRLAMYSVRQWFTLLDREAFDPIHDAYTVLYKNLGLDTGMRNDILAHIGWAVVLLDKAHPGYYFDQVLMDEPDHVYALVFKSYWLLTGRIAELTSEERYQQARALFQKARQNTTHQSFVVFWYLSALDKSSLVESAEYVRQVIYEREIIEQFEFSEREDIRSELDALMTNVIRQSAIGDDALFESQFAHLDNNEIELLLQIVFAGDDLQQQVTVGVLKALYQAHNHNPEELLKALAGYGAALAHYKNGELSSAQVVAYALPKLINQVCERLNGLTTDPLCQSE